MRVVGLCRRQANNRASILEVFGFVLSLNIVLLLIHATDGYTVCKPLRMDLAIELLNPTNDIGVLTAHNELFRQLNRLFITPKTFHMVACRAGHTL